MTNTVAGVREHSSEATHVLTAQTHLRTMNDKDLDTLINMSDLLDSKYGDAFRKQYPNLVAQFKDLVMRLEDDTQS